MKGTILEGTTTPLHIWFYTMYQLYTSKNGVSAMEIKNQCGVTYKTAWRMTKQIRSKLGEATKFSGTTEIDETFVGGKKKLNNKGGKGIGDKAIVFGIRERKSNKIRLYAVKNKSKETLLPLIDEAIQKGTKVYSDKYAVYLALGDMGFDHKVIKSKRVKTEVSTSGIETVWSYFKTPMKGTHRHVSAKHMQKYLDEFAYRYNNPDGAFTDFVQKVFS